MNASYFKSHIKALLRSPFFYAVCLLLSLIPSADFLLSAKLSGSTGVINLHNFFSSFPYVSILVIPALGSLTAFSKRDFTFPYTSFEIVFSKNAALLCVFTAAFLLPSLCLAVALSLWGSVEAASFFTSVLGMILYAFSAFSVTVFFGVLISHAGIAFVVSALVLLFIETAQNIPFLKWCFKHFSFYWHFSSFSKGILDCCRSRKA